MSLPPKRTGWHTVKENVQHPDHEDVIGDLCQNVDTGHFQMLVYNEMRDNYDRYAVPHKWAVREAEQCGS